MVKTQLRLAVISAGFAGVLATAALSEMQRVNDQLVGIWTPVKAENTLPDGTKAQQFGPNPQGQLIFTADGRYSLQLYIPEGRPKFVSNNRMQGTAEEYKAIAQASIAHYGRYSVAEGDKALTFHVERSTFPNWDGQDQKRAMVLRGDELAYHVAVSSAGGKAELVWKRAKSAQASQ